MSEILENKETKKNEQRWKLEVFFNDGRVTTYSIFSTMIVNIIKKELEAITNQSFVTLKTSNTDQVTLNLTTVMNINIIAI